MALENRSQVVASKSVGRRGPHPGGNPKGEIFGEYYPKKTSEIGRPARGSNPRLTTKYNLIMTKREYWTNESKNWMTNGDWSPITNHIEDTIYEDIVKTMYSTLIKGMSLTDHKDKIYGDYIIDVNGYDYTGYEYAKMITEDGIENLEDWMIPEIPNK